MANKLDPMDLKQLLSLHLDGLSNRDIGATLGISRNTVNGYMRQFKASGLDFRELLDLDDGSLKELFPARTTILNPRYDELMCFFEQMQQDRHHPGFTFQYHYNQYKQEANNPYSYTQFLEHYKRKYKQPKGSMKLDHQAGKELFVDFAGKKLHIVDKETGEQLAVEIFVAILPHSQYTYVQACSSQSQADFLACMANCLKFYGGVPKAIVSDNLKSAVQRASKYEPIINRNFKDFARHYDCVINPTRTYAPQDKALVENAVQLAYQRIYYPLRNMIFFTIEELNKEIRGLLEAYNQCLFQVKQSSRQELFQRVERQYLKPLPASDYELKEYRRAKVQKMGYVYFSPDKSYYSVPHRYIGKHTSIHFTKTTVEVYYNYERIALHKRCFKTTYITNQDHLASTHKAYNNWSPAYFKKKAQTKGEHVYEFVCGMFEHETTYPEPMYKRANGLIILAKQYGNQRLNLACKRAIQAGSFSYHRVKNILKNGLEQEVLQTELFEGNRPHIPEHDNIRGAKAYQ